MALWGSLSEGRLTLYINDGEGLVYVAAGHNAAGGHDAARAALVLLDVEPDHAIFRGDLRHLLVVNGAQMLDEDWAPLHRAQIAHVNRITKGELSEYYQNPPQCIPEEQKDEAAMRRALKMKEDPHRQEVGILRGKG